MKRKLSGLRTAICMLLVLAMTVTIWPETQAAGTTKKVYQDRIWYNCEKLNIEYNNDGTVCIRNGDGLYLDIQGGEAVSGAHLMYAPKSGSNSQKFVFNLVKK